MKKPSPAPSVDVSSFFEEVDAESARERRLARSASNPITVSDKTDEENLAEEARKRRLERQQEKEKEQVEKPLKKQSERTWKGESVKTSDDEKQCTSNEERRPATDEEKKALCYWEKSWEVSLQGDKYFLYADGKKVMEMNVRSEYERK